MFPFLFIIRKLPIISSFNPESNRIKIVSSCIEEKEPFCQKYKYSKTDDKSIAKKLSHKSLKNKNKNKNENKNNNNDILLLTSFVLIVNSNITKTIEIFAVAWDFVQKILNIDALRGDNCMLLGHRP